MIGESSANGILIESDFNSVLHNAIYGSGAAGVRVQDPDGSLLVITTGNLIGGSSAAEENTIRESGDDAIQIVDLSGNTEEDSYNQVGRNKGDSNVGRFISLIGNANAGIEPPVFTAQDTSASGSGAEPNATIRVFRKKTSALGEVESFLAEVEADGAGSWKATYPPNTWGNDRRREPDQCPRGDLRIGRRRKPRPIRPVAVVATAATMAVATTTAVAATKAARKTPRRPTPRSPKARPRKPIRGR